MSTALLAVIAVILCILFRILNVNSQPQKPSLWCGDNKFLDNVLKISPLLSEPYIPTRLWGFSGHVQTIIHSVIGRVKCPWPMGERIFLTLSDGTTLTYDMYQPLDTNFPDDISIAICPGICNTSESVYIRTFVHWAQYHGYRCAVLNHVGALPKVPVTAPRIFSYGNTDDYHAMLLNLLNRHPNTKLVCVGFSLGGNLVTKYLGEKDRVKHPNIIGGISICQGYNAIEGTKWLLNWQNFRRFYLYVMTENLKNIILRHSKVLLSEEAKQRFQLVENEIISAATLPELDEAYTRKVHGFGSITELYHWSSSINYLHNIEKPIIFVNAKDDPIVPEPLLEPIRKVAVSSYNSMSDKDYAPLSAACVRALNDKLYDKRKTAALEIEKMVKEFAAVNNTGQIKRMLKILGQDFALSQNPHARKGGLIGLAAIAIALGKDTACYTEELIKPILGCLSDQDLRVRYYACESLYNVVKVARSSVLPHFPTIFNSLSKIATDSDQNIKNASELLDRLLKDIVAESPKFDLEGFIPLLRERIYTKSPFSRQFIISWISVLNSEPGLDLISYLPEILDGLFRILEDTNLEVKKMCETALGEFLRIIKADPSKVNFGAMINILINHAQEKNDELVQFTAITWIKEFVQLSGPAMLPFMSGIFTAILPCLAFEADARRMTDIKETATAVNFTLMKLIALQDRNDHPEVRPNDYDTSDIPHEIDLESVVEVLIQYLMHNSIQTKVAVLKWIYDLYTKLPNKMVNYIDVLFPALQRTLSDEADQVVQQCLVVIAEVISPPKSEKGDSKGTYYNKFIVSLLYLFNNDKSLLNERGSFIIRQLCVLLNAEDIYLTLGTILLNETNLKFASLMVDHLNMILLTSSELFEMRNRLKDLSIEENRQLFVCIYKTWCHNPVATVSLCLLTQSYSHVCELIKLFGSIEVTVDFLMEIDKLVQLIESPIFAYLRLELLEVPCDKYLVRALYGLLMLLPQTEAFSVLKNRLSCIPSLQLQVTEKLVEKKQPQTLIDFGPLLSHFKEVQEKHKEYKKSNRTKDMLSFSREGNADDT